MQLSEQQLAELERRGWRLEITCGEFGTWVKGQSIATLYADGFCTFSGNLKDALELTAIAAGYRLVPEEVAGKVLPIVQAMVEQKRIAAEALIGQEERAEAFEEYRALMALASALQGEGGGEAVSERWKLGWLESYNAYTGEPERFVYRPGDDEHTRICVRGENCDEDARRIVASVNACLGIPTETLEAGVVVVPVEELRKRLPALIRATAEMVLSERRKLDNDQLDEELKDLSALSQTTAKMESKLGSFMEWLSRLQQNGGETR